MTLSVGSDAHSPGPDASLTAPDPAPAPLGTEPVARLAGARVLCVGDVMLDRFVHGVVERISPEAPIPVLAVRDQREMLGGAGNVVRNLVALGAGCTVVSVVGTDPAGETVRRLLAEEPGVIDGLRCDPGRRTSVKTRFLAGAQQLLRADEESVAPLTPAQAEAVIARAGDCLASGWAQVVVVSDYGKGVVSDVVVAALIALGRAHGRPVIVDPKGRDFARYHGADLITPNRKELAEATGLPATTDAEVVAAARRVQETCGIDAVLATRSQDGMTLVAGRATPAAGAAGAAGATGATGATGAAGTGAPETGVFHLPAQAREVFDVSGAGDTVLATLAAALAVGLAPVTGCRLANTAAGLAVGRIGTAAVSAADLITALHHQDLDAGDVKVVSRAEACDRVGKWRRQGLTVGFTNGCFDLLHPGHLALLREARAACDRLVVGLNSDQSVARLKGPGRPVQSEAARAAVLAAVTGVDLVVIFTEDTPLSLIRDLLPDVLVKGADYTLDRVVGADEVLAAGGRVVLARLIDGFSTTRTLARLTKSEPPPGG